MKKTIGVFPSSSGLCNVHYYIYSPEKPRAVLMFSHGMCDHIERYEEFAEFLCKNDIAFVGNDHIGHGNSVLDENMRGFFGQERGYINMVRDLHRMKLIINKRFADIPHFLMGHSMGSFLARIYLSKYRDRWSGAIIMGTAGGLTGAVPYRKLLDLIERDRGDYYRPKLGSAILMMFNRRIDDRRTPADWLSRDDKNVDKFIADPKCNFLFTIAGFRDMLNALLCSNSKAVIENTPTNIPLLFLSGSMDPIGQYGKGVHIAVMKYANHGCDVNIRIYRDARHELIFELNRDEVMKDIYSFLVKRI